MGRGSRQRTRVDASGFPKGHLMRSKKAFGFQTGDLAKAVVPTGKREGAHAGGAADRAAGSFNIKAAGGLAAAS